MFDRIQLLRALQQFSILIGLLRGLPGGDPVIEGFAGVTRIRLRRIAQQSCLILGQTRFLCGLLRVLQLRPQRRGFGFVDVIIQLELAIDTGQVFNDLAAQTDQKTGKNQCHQP
ncbi:MAG: hypothetical protein ACOVKN_08855 [Arenimonas sp.]